MLADGFGFRQGVDGRLPGGGEQGRRVEPSTLPVLEEPATGRYEKGLREFFGAGIGTEDLQPVEQLTVEASPLGGEHRHGERQQHAQARRVGCAALGGVEHEFQPGQRGARGVDVDFAVEVEHGGAHGADVFVVARGGVAEVGIDQGRQGVQVLGAGLPGVVAQAIDQRKPGQFGGFDGAGLDAGFLNGDLERRKSRRWRDGGSVAKRRCFDFFASCRGHCVQCVSTRLGVWRENQFGHVFVLHAPKALAAAAKGRP